MADFITSIANIAALRTWWDSTVPGTIPSGDRYIAELAAGDYDLSAVSQTWGGKTTTGSTPQIIIRPAAPLSSTSRPLRYSASDGVRWLIPNSDVDFSAFRVDVQGIQVKNSPATLGRLRLTAYSFFTRCILSECGLGFIDIGNGYRDCLIAADNATFAVSVNQPSSTMDGCTVINFGAGVAATLAQATLGKNNVFISMGGAVAVDGAGGFASGSTNNAFYGTGSGGTNAATITPSAEFTNVASLAAADMRLLSGATIKTTGAVGIGSGLDVYQQTRSGSAPARGAIEAISAAPVITGPTGTAGASSITHTVNENQNAAGTWTATDSASWSLTGTDAAAFNISGGVVTKASGNFDYETKASYSFNVVNGSASQAVTLNITNLPELSVPTKSTPTSASLVGGFTTDITDGTAHMVWTQSASQPSATQIKAGQNAAGSSTSPATLSPADLTITSAGAKTFAAATGATSGATYYGWVVHTNAGGTDSAVLALGAAYPGTGRPVSDVSVAGWTPTGAASAAAALNEDSPGSDAEYITSPALSGSATTASMALDKTYPAGTYSIKVRASVDTGTGNLVVRLLNGSDVSQGVTANQALTTTPTTYTLSITTTGDATRIRVEVTS